MVEEEGMGSNSVTHVGVSDQLFVVAPLNL